MAGGTGLYIKAFTEGLDEMPAVDKKIREKIKDLYEQKGLGWLQEEIRRKDPDFYRQGEVLNPQRLMRALEIQWATGRSILSFRTGEKKVMPFRFIKIALDLPRETLRSHIDWRVERMMEEGLLEEVRSLLLHKNRNALQTVGYREIIQHLDGAISLGEAVARIKINTWQYAKRQMTWLKKQEAFHWVNPGDAYTLQKIIKS
jgi:tRNA dimethylallyltransferase